MNVYCENALRCGAVIFVYFLPYTVMEIFTEGGLVMFRIKLPGKKNTGQPGTYYDNWSNYYQSNHNMPKRLVERKGRRGLFTRIAVTVLLLVILLVAGEIQLPAGRQVRESVRYLLTAEWNFEPLLQGAVRVASQIVNWDNPMFNNWPYMEVTKNVVSEEFWVPVSGKVVREFGWSEDPLDGLKRFHPGVDINAEPGTPVRAVMDGQVVRVGKDSRLGEYILLNHGSGTYTMYAGIKGILLKEGQWVLAGQEIAEVGEHGDVPGGGLHFELREKDELVNPLNCLHTGR